MAHAIHPVDILLSGSSKRKREDSPNALSVEPSIEVQDAKRRKQDTLVDEAPTPVVISECRKSEKITATAPSSRIQETIEIELGTEILLKHNELRLINQELAKCQVALEQLRRCHLIPYPTSQGTYQSMLNVTNGTGASVWQKGNVPQWAPPYGVTDGPYVRHYSKWLIPDPSFDGEQVEWHRSFEGSRASKTFPAGEGRATRNSFAESGTPVNKSRSHRGSAGPKLQALSSGYPQAKEKAGPCVLKRGDGQTVKLVCIDCKRDNFSSTQGFINHCRIAHHRDFKSHEEAAVASGQAIEVDEVGGIVGEEKSPTVANGLVHPLIRSAPADKGTYIALLSRIEASMELYNQGKLPGFSSVPSSVASTPVTADFKANVHSNSSFVPSTDTPNLSKLMQSKGFTSNLTELVGEARRSFDSGYEDSSHDEDSEGESMDQHTQLNADSLLPAMRMPARATMPPAQFGRPVSSKGVDGSYARVPSGISPRLSHALPAISSTPIMPPVRPSTHLMTIQTPSHIETPRRHSDGMDIDMMQGPSIHDLSPHTVASNNAPSLVSDDGDEDADDVESVASEESGSDVAEIEIQDGVANVVPRNRSGSGSDVRLKKEDKHVTFVSPVKDSGTERRKN